MFIKKMFKLSMAAFLLIAFLALPVPKIAAAGITNQNSEEVTEVKPTAMTNENSTAASYSVLLTTATDYQKSIPVPVDGVGKLFINLHGNDVTKGISVNLYSSADCSEESKIKYGTSLYDTGTDKVHSWDISKAGTYYLAFDTSKFGDPINQSLNFQLLFIHSDSTLTSGKIAYGTTLNYGYTYYKVTAPKTGYFTVELANAGEGDYGFTVNLCDSKKKFYEQNGEYLSKSAPQKTVFAVKKGTYYIAVKTSNQAFGIKQTFTAGVDNGGASKEKAVSIAKGKTKKGVFAVNDSKTAADWYKIKITKSQKVDFTFVGDISLGSVTAEVFSGTKSIGSKRLDGIDANASFNIYTFGNNNKLSPGTYYIKISKNGNATANGHYSLKFN